MRPPQSDMALSLHVTVDIRVASAEICLMQDAPPAAIVAQQKPAVPVIGVEFPNWKERAAQYEAELTALNQQLWRRVNLTKTAYYYVDGTGSFLQLLIDIRPPSSARYAESFQVTVDYMWDNEKLKTVTYACNRKTVASDCVEKIFLSLKRVAPFAVGNAPPRHLIF
ncbi:hypothetical protein [Sphingomonas sp. Leaf22]|uniref:hypothetical protein n=1 Tax=Sphingomonas sp. Leaf22 TaxID=1735687 RepID=UPI0012E2ECEE|nr:hypothetical protein [Sphingomonas sp. Leaf22]